MSQSVAEITAHNAHEWKRLEFLLAQRKGTTVIWVSCDTFHKKEAVLDEMQTRLADRYQPFSLNLDQHSATSLLRNLQSQVPADIQQSPVGSWMVHVLGLETLLARTREPEVPPILVSMNFERELIFQEFPFLLAIWATPLATIQVQRQAPDFWDWVANRFEFLSSPEELISVEEKAEAVSSSIIKTRDPARAHRINRLREQYRRMTTAEESNPIELLNLGERLANEYHLLPDYEQAITTYRKTLAGWTEQAGDHRESQARLLQNLGRVYEEKGDLLQAQACFEQDTQLQEAILEANPHSESLKNGLAISYEKMGDILKAQGQFEQALDFFQKQTDLFEQLFHANPHSESLKHGLANSYGMVGDLLGQMGQMEKSLEEIQKATDLFEQLFQANPHSFELHRGLGVSYSKLGQVFEKMGKVEEAREKYQKAKTVFQQLWEQSKIPQLQQWVGIVDGKLKELG